MKYKVYVFETSLTFCLGAEKAAHSDERKSTLVVIESETNSLYKYFH